MTIEDKVIKTISDAIEEHISNGKEIDKEYVIKAGILASRLTEQKVRAEMEQAEMERTSRLIAEDNKDIQATKRELLTKFRKIVRNVRKDHAGLPMLEAELRDLEREYLGDGE